MTLNYPLRFEPLFRQYLWGGRRLGTVLGKPIGKEGKYAESWEIVDHQEDQSVAATGDFAGQTLHDLVVQHAVDLFGRHAPLGEFPLLFKLLDAQQTLSVQVHPNDEQAARLDPPDRGKTEAWVILDAEPGSVIYAGLKRGFDRAALAREIDRGTTELCLQKLEPQAGDCVFIPAGTVHALGAGLLVAEIQQSSDTTYRLFDWNRVDAHGKSRELHIEQGLGVIDFEREPCKFQSPRPTDREDVERLVACDKFVLDRWRPEGKTEIGGDGRFHILCVVDGQVEIAGDPTGKPLIRGETCLLPAAAGSAIVSPTSGAVLLDMYLPQ